MPHWAQVAFVMGIFVLGAALFVPALVDATQNDAKQTVALNVGNSTNLTDKLQVTLVAIDTTGTPDNATIEYKNLDTLDTNQTTIDEGDNATVTLSGDDITGGMETVDSQSATFNNTYPPMFGWGSGARTFFQNIELVIVLLGGVMIFGGLAAIYD